MIISTSAPTPRPDAVEWRHFNGQWYGLQLADFTGPVPEAAKYYHVFRPTILNSTPVRVPKRFVGLTVENVGNGNGQSTPPWSMGVQYSIHRLLAEGTYWAQIERNADGNFDWTKLDAAVELAVAAGKEVMLNVAYTPYGHAANKTVKRSSGASTLGWPSPPADLAATMQTYPALNSAVWGRFIRALVRRYKGRIKYYVGWNEPNYRMANSARQVNAPCGNWFDATDTWNSVIPGDYTTPRSSVIGDVQRYGQLVQLLADMYGIVSEEDPDAIVLGPDFYGEAGSQSVGGKQDGVTCFAAFLAAGGGSFCHGYAWHPYMDEGDGDDRGNIDGVSRRLVPVLKALEVVRVAAGAPARPWRCTEAGHNVLTHLPLDDQIRWVKRQIRIAASLGWQAWVMYVWDSLNPATTQMSLWAPPGLNNPGKRAIADALSQEALLIEDSTIDCSVMLSDGRWCGTRNGIPEIV